MPSMPFDVGLLHITWGQILMIVIALGLIYLGIGKKMEPLLLVPIGFGMLLVNLPLGGLMETMKDGVLHESYVLGGQPVGLLARIFDFGIATELIPPLIFLGLGALTDFGPMIAEPKMLLLGAGAQFGVYLAFFAALAIGALTSIHFGVREAASIGIIGGADGPTTIYLTSLLAPDILGITAVAAYSYMALVPIIQPPVIRLLTTKEERAIYMKPQTRPVSALEKLIFPMLGVIVTLLVVPKAAPLLGMFFFGNLLQVSGVTERLANTAGNAFMDILTFLLGLCVGAFMSADNFLQPRSLLVFVLGLLAFAGSTAFGVVIGKVMNLLSKEKINPMLGAAGVSAVPMSARVVQRMGQKANPRNFLLMHAMGPNVAGVIGTAIAAGVFLGMIAH